ncbi:MAG: hypothetical protein ACKVZH_28690 [Blastocatellia bacterium]
MNKEWVLTKEEFDCFLEWLGEGRDKAAAEYESIRRRLVIFFNCRGCRDPESLADEAINRVIRKLPTFADSYTGDKAKIFYGFAKFVYLEYLNESSNHEDSLMEFLRRMNQPETDDEQQHIYQCLSHCLQKQPEDKQKMFIAYYLVERNEKVEHHQKLAREFDLSIGALRKKMFDLKNKLFDCVKNCLKK